MARLKRHKVTDKRTKSGKSKTREQIKRGTKWLACSQCVDEELRVDADVVSVICPKCVQGMIEAPKAPKPQESQEEKTLRAERKIQRLVAKEAKKLGRKFQTKDLGFGRGWHLKKVFTTSLGEKPQYFSLGKEITKAEYDKLAKQVDKVKAAKIKPTAGYGRGWHLKKKFVSPDGQVYCYGKVVTKGEKPTGQHSAHSRKGKVKPKKVRRGKKTSTKRLSLKQQLKYAMKASQGKATVETKKLRRLIKLGKRK